MTKLPRPQQEREALVEALDTGPVVIGAGPGALPAEFVCESWRGSTLRVDAAVAGTVDGFSVDVTREVLRHLAPNSHIGLNVAATHKDDLVALARAFGRRIDDGISAGMGLPSGDFSIDDALKAVPAGTLLIVESAHLLTQKWAGRTLWTLRGRAEERQLRVALVSPLWAEDRLLHRDAAFFGFGNRLTVSNEADLDAWTRALGERWDEPEIEWAVRRTTGQFAAMLEVVSRAERDRPSLRSAVETIVSARTPLVSATTRAAQSLTTLGGRLVRALALGHQPYPAVPHAAPNRIASGLKILERSGLVYSPARAHWRLSDPLLAAAFRGAEASREPA